MSGDRARTPTLEELLRRAGRALLDGMEVCLPARVESYDETRQCVNAQPLIQRERVGEDGETVVERLPVVTRCPVRFPGSGPYRITWPVAVGSVVVLHFTSASIDRWLAIGGEVNPEDDRRLTLSDAFADPGGHSFAGSTAPQTTAPQDAMVLHAAALQLGGPAATSAVALAAEMAALKAAFASWVAGATAADVAAGIKAIFAAWSAPGATTTKAL